MKKIMGPVKVEGEYRIRHNKELYQQLERIITVSRRRTLNFYGHIVSVNNQRLSSTVFDTVSEGKATRAKWVRLVREHLTQLGLDHM